MESQLPLKKLPSLLCLLTHVCSTSLSSRFIASTQLFLLIVVLKTSHCLEVSLSHKNYIIMSNSVTAWYLSSLSLSLSLYVVLISRTMRTIYVEREDPDSRMKAAEEIRRRAHTRGEWPKVLLFPEGIFLIIIITYLYAYIHACILYNIGTTTNTKVLITFKQGAFLPKLPVQPVLIKYKNKLVCCTQTKFIDFAPLSLSLSLSLSLPSPLS